MDIIELFAGVGGFRLGVEKANKDNKVVWSNQWEPSTKKQHASDVYEARFGKNGHCNEDISKVEAKDIPTHNMLCGGFPCQSFSVMRPNHLSKGLEGEKGILWWEIHRIVSEHKTNYLMLENVDRLLLSPSKQRGRDFAVIIKTLMDLDYTVEWRVINAAEYGYPQKRRRTFIFAYKNTSPISEALIKGDDLDSSFNLLKNEGIFAQTFPIENFDKKDIKEVDLSKEVYDISDFFNKDNKDKKPFFNAGIAIGGKAYSIHSKPNHKGDYTLLKDVILDNKDIDTKFFVKDKEKYQKWVKAKDKISKERINKITGEKYTFKGGALPFPDKLDSPARTIITSEGGSSASRTTHIIKTKNKLRRLHPIELERLNGFPDDHTKLEGISDTKRGFLMGNALVVGIVEKLSKTIEKYK